MVQVDTDGNMLVKCVCGNCGHSFLTDDQAGDLTCPRCGFLNDGEPVGGFVAPKLPSSGLDQHHDAHRGTPASAFAPTHFDPKAPPPVFASWGRMVRGMLFGGLVGAFMGAVVGAAMTATGIHVPGVAALIMAIAAGAGARYGLGGRAARRTRGYAYVAAIVAVVIGSAGILAGSWLVERHTGTRATQARKDLDMGKRLLTRDLARAQKADDVPERTRLQTLLRRTERLEAYSNAQLEDYLWTQQAQINQPLAAYAKLRVENAPLLRLGADRKPVEAPKHVPLAIAGAELLLAMLLACRGVKHRF